MRNESALLKVHRPPNTLKVAFSQLPRHCFRHTDADGTVVANQKPDGTPKVCRTEGEGSDGAEAVVSVHRSRWFPEKSATGSATVGCWCRWPSKVCCSPPPRFKIKKSQEHASCLLSLIQARGLRSKPVTTRRLSGAG
jgi:hypothetical protein